jgi:hypothetical protein
MINLNSTRAFYFYGYFYFYATDLTRGRVITPSQ